MRAYRTDLLKFTGIFILVASIIGTAATSLYRLAQLEMSVKEQQTELKAMEKDIQRVEYEVLIR